MRTNKTKKFTDILQGIWSCWNTNLGYFEIIKRSITLASNVTYNGYCSTALRLLQNGKGLGQIPQLTVTSINNYILVGIYLMFTFFNSKM